MIERLPVTPEHPEFTHARESSTSTRAIWRGYALFRDVSALEGSRRGGLGRVHQQVRAFRHSGHEGWFVERARCGCCDTSPAPSLPIAAVRGAERSGIARRRPVHIATTRARSRRGAAGRSASGLRIPRRGRRRAWKADGSLNREESSHDRRELLRPSAAPSRLRCPRGRAVTAAAFAGARVLYGQRRLQPLVRYTDFLHQLLPTNRGARDAGAQVTDAHVLPSVAPPLMPRYAVDLARAGFWLRRCDQSHYATARSPHRGGRGLRGEAGSSRAFASPRCEGERMTPSRFDVLAHRCRRPRLVLRGGACPRAVHPRASS